MGDVFRDGSPPLRYLNRHRYPSHPRGETAGLYRDYYLISVSFRSIKVQRRIYRTSAGSSACFRLPFGRIGSQDSRHLISKTDWTNSDPAFRRDRCLLEILECEDCQRKTNCKTQPDQKYSLHHTEKSP